MRPKRNVLTRARVTVTVTLTLYGWLALNSPAIRRAVCGEPAQVTARAAPTMASVDALVLVRPR